MKPTLKRHACDCIVLFVMTVLGATACAAQSTQGSEQTFQHGIAQFQAGDKTGAFASFLSAARAGHVKAAVQVGWCYEFGEGVKQSESQAAQWYRTGADGGNSRGQNNLGALYESGRGVSEDWVEAAKWYAKSAAQGDADGEAALGRAYQFGIGVPQSRADAIAWDKKAAAQGEEDSAYFAHWLADPTNNIGFRNPGERNAVMGYRMVDVIIQNEPAGIAFRNSSERMRYLSQSGERLDRDERFAHWWVAEGEFTRCRAAHQSSCRDPGPAPR
jgi:TPR repeat protein